MSEQEVDLLTLRPSWKDLIPWVLFAVPAGVVCGVLVERGSWLGGNGLLAGAGVFVLLVVISLLSVGFNRLATELRVTNRRCILRTGILSRHTNEVRHSDVRNIQVSQGIIARVLGIGTVAISTAGQSGIEIKITGIDSPMTVRDTIEKHRG